MRIENKIVPIYANSEAGDRCHVKQLDAYFSKIPDQARQLDIFYLRPLGNIPDDPTRPWFAATPVGENKLGAMVKDKFTEVGIVNKTNHSLRATGATNLYTANVPEKLIQQRTGHHSVKALRIYEQTTGEQECRKFGHQAAELTTLKLGSLDRKLQENLRRNLQRWLLHPYLISSAQPTPPVTC